jgi:hypothetical protein
VLRISYFTSLGIFTLVERTLQISPFCTNKPNFRKSQMSISDYITKEYETMDTWWSGKNKPNTNPIQTQSNPIKANKMPKQTQFKPKQTQFTPIFDYPCIFELAVYNLVFRNCNLTNFYGDFIKWQMRQEQTQ